MAFIKCDRIFIEQVRTARPNVSDADADTIIETHFADWFSQNVSITTHCQNVSITTHSFIILTEQLGACY